MSKSNVVSMNKIPEMNIEKLSTKGAQLINIKLSKEAETHGEKMTPEQSLWLGVIAQAVKDLSWVIERYRKEAWYFLNGNAGDIEAVCSNAGLNAESVRRVIKTVYELPEYRKIIDPNDDFLERAKVKRTA